MKNGVVLDQTYAKALVSIARAESLLFINDRADGVFDNWKDLDVPMPLRRCLLENLVIGGRFIVPLPVADGVSGPLVDSGTLTPVQDHHRGIWEHGEDVRSAFGYSPTVLAGVLATHGLRVSPEGVLGILARAQEALERLQSLGEKPEVAYDQFLRPVKYMMLSKEALAAHQDKLAAHRDWVILQREARPLFDALSSFAKVSSLAQDLDAHPLIPTTSVVFPDSPRQYDCSVDHIKDGGRVVGQLLGGTKASAVEQESLVLLRLTAEALGRTPCRRTLAETVQLAARPETQALREQLDRWTTAIQRGDVEGTAKILQEVTRARKELDNLERWSSVDRLMTILGVPVGVAGMFSPVLSAIGVAMSVVGVTRLVQVSKKRKNYSWVMFGD